MMKNLKNIVAKASYTLFFAQLVLLNPLVAGEYRSNENNDAIVEKKELTVLETAFIEIATPYIKRVKLDRIYIADDFDHTLYTGGVQIHENSARIMFGSEFRSMYEKLSDDAYAEILCHELGHIVGETSLENSPTGEEISPEAESDYFAGAVCLKKLFRKYPSTDILIPDPLVMSTCAKQYTENEDQKLCERVAMAGVDFFTSFHHSFKRAKIISGTEDFYAIPDLSKKDQRFYTFYPSFQCRAETLASGAYCTTSEQDFDRGASNWHCQKSVDPVGARPSCWYKW